MTIRSSMARLPGTQTRAQRLLVPLAATALALAALAASGRQARAAENDCSVAHAAAAATAAGFHTGDFPDGKAHIVGLICGPFFGSGSAGMAGMVPVGAGCGVSIAWLVLRFDGGRWRVALKHEGGAQSLQPVGADIKETQGYPRSGDPPCSPSRKRTRIWHWNGSVFTASAWTVTAAPATKAEPKPRYFYSPTRNLDCSMHDDHQYRGVKCSSDKAPQRVAMNISGALRICKGRRCVSECGCKDDTEPILSYGKQMTVGRFECTSLEIGVKCTVIQSGRGFMINRRTITRIGR